MLIYNNDVLRYLIIAIMRGPMVNQVSPIYAW